MLPNEIRELLMVGRPRTADELRNMVYLLPPLEGSRWGGRQASLRFELQTNNLDRVLEMATIRATMFVGSNAPWSEHEFKYLKHRYAPKILRPLLIDPGVVGTDLIQAPDWNYTSGSYVEQLTHLTLWEDETGREVKDLRTILEYGGGYGAMRVIAHRKGFRGDYAIYDLPEVLLIQAYYLNQLRGSDKSLAATTWFVDDPGDLPAAPPDLVVGIASLSEMPPAERVLALGDRPVAGSYLIRYQPVWDGVDNDAWFHDWAGKTEGYRWVDLPAPGLSDWYLIGVRE